MSNSTEDLIHLNVKENKMSFPWNLKHLKLILKLLPDMFKDALNVNVCQSNICFFLNGRLKPHLSAVLL